LMITENGPKMIEYNVRFGDPECQTMLPLLDGDWGQVFNSLAAGQVLELKWKPLSVACVVQAAPGYPDNPEKGVVIQGDLGYQSSSSYFLHAGTAKASTGEWTVNGGRVLNSIGLGSSMPEALKAAYAQAKMVTWKGMQMRKDIGANAPK
jgi:phosphoribosylamine--glycine ligase